MKDHTAVPPNTSECYHTLQANENFVLPDVDNATTSPLLSMTDHGTQTLVIQRSLYTQPQLDAKYPDQTPNRPACELMKKRCLCSPVCLARQAISLFPVVVILRRYKWRDWICSDLIAGLCSGFVHLPQGLAFGILASLNAVNGLYTSFFAIITYIIFGTSPHMSMGTNAVVALLTANLVESEAEIFESELGSNFTLSHEEIMQHKVGVAACASLIGGLILCAMFLFRLGFVTSYLSKSFMNGFTFAAAVHIIISQAVKMLHIKTPPRSGIGRLPLLCVDIASNIHHSVPADVVMGLVCMAILLSIKLGINERFKHKLRIPIPAELVVVIIATIISHFARLHERFQLGVVGSISTGFPTPSLPEIKVNTVSRVSSEAFMIAILGFALSISFAKICAKMNSYDKVDDNQELLAHGLCMIVGGFFESFPASTAPPRTMILSSLGSKSTLNGVSAAIFMLLILLVAGHLFVSLPIAMLAAMIMVSMKDILMQGQAVPEMWRVNKRDFLIWIVTVFVCIGMDLAYGLFAGVAFSILTVLSVGQLAVGSLLGRSKSEDLIYISKRKGIQNIPSISIFRFESQLYFASAERFKKQIYQIIFNPVKKINKARKIKVTADCMIDSSPKLTENGSVMIPSSEEKRKEKTEKDDSQNIHHLILECSAMTYIDLAGIDMLVTTIREFNRAGVEVMLACVPHSTLQTLQRAKVFQLCITLQAFPAIEDAVETAQTLTVFCE